MYSGSVSSSHTAFEPTESSPGDEHNVCKEDEEDAKNRT